MIDHTVDANKMIDWVLPVRTVSEANQTDHWTVVSKRKKAQRALIQCRWNKEKPSIPLPCVVKLTRISPRKLDDDNLVMALKHVRDVVADLIRPGLPPGFADGSGLIKWQYDQVKGATRSVRIEILLT